LYNEYNAKVAEVTAGQQNALKAQFEDLWKSRGIDPSKRRREKPYSGAVACKACHQEAYDMWATTTSRHANAFATLKKTGQQSDPECVSCHTTGAMQRGGFTNTKDTPDLINVQCEACHGGGTSHAAKPIAGFGAVSEDLCRSCHTEAYNPDFDFEQMLKLIPHKKQ
jgi:predicted CXXCH cytochrome family protein